MNILTEAQAKTGYWMAELAKSQAHTDERLNTLIDVVERYISKGDNGAARH